MHVREEGNNHERTRKDISMEMKTIEVVAAVIRDVEGRYYATQRGYGDMKDGWEFPGGKIEPGETPEEALRREIREELQLEIEVDKYITMVEWDYPKFHLTMHCYFCHILTGQPVLLEHEAARWLYPDQFDEVDWLPADQVVVREMKDPLQTSSWKED